MTVTNTGSATWQSQGATEARVGEVRIGTATPRDRPSLFRYLSWLSPNRVINAGTSIRPGERLTVSFTIQAPAQPGNYHEEFQFVSEYVAWFGPTFGWDIHVI